MLVDTGLISSIKPKDTVEAVRRRDRDKKRTRKVDRGQGPGALKNRAQPDGEPEANLDRYV